MVRKILFLLLFLLFSSRWALAEVPIEIDLGQGGAITYVGLDGENVVDESDCGYLLQLALYDDDMPKTAAGASCLPENPTYTFAWDPVQACDGCRVPHFSQILAGTEKSFVRVKPLLWIGNGTDGDFVIEQRISQTSLPNAVKVSYKIIHEGSDYHERLKIELPATWIKNKFSKFVYYNGYRPWSNDTLKETTSYLDSSKEEYIATENWGALVDPATNRGIAVYNPHSYQVMNFIPEPALRSATRPRYFTSWLLYEFPPHTEADFDFYILTGSISEMRSSIYNLPKNTNYLVYPSGQFPESAEAGSVLNVPMKVTNKTLAVLNRTETVIAIKRRKFDGPYISDSNWVTVQSDVIVGETLTMNLPIEVPRIPGKYVFIFYLLINGERTLTGGAGFPPYEAVVDVLPSPLSYLGMGWNMVLDKGSYSTLCTVVDFREKRYYRCPQVVNF